MTPSPAIEAAPAKVNFAYVVIVGLAAGLASLISLFAWPFGILTGIVIGRSDAERRAGIRQPASLTIIRYLGVTGGVLAMAFFGAFIGLVGGFIVAALAAFNERVLEGTGPTDRGIGRIAFIVVTIVTWVVVAMVLNVHVNIGGTNPTP
ncbi:MAG TPA: hypothetical protein VF484_06850 [Candidatus Limnocylindrales bacterium]